MVNTVWLRDVKVVWDPVIVTGTKDVIVVSMMLLGVLLEGGDVSDCVADSVDAALLAEGSGTAEDGEGGVAAAGDEGKRSLIEHRDVVVASEDVVHQNS